ncbi:MAG: PAS domain-containing protein [Planctomycetota bacterium]|nr:MAG: PAS domain-containing protein [Planctomycetota bacterium]
MTPSEAGLLTARSFIEQHGQDYARQVRRYFIGRLLVLLAALAILLVYEEGSPRRFFGAYATLLVGLGLATLQLGLLRRIRDRERYAATAVGIDLLLATLTAYFTGGIYNIGFSFLFFAAILAAVLLVSDRAAWAAASLASVALAGTALVYWYASQGPFAPPLLNESFCAEVVQQTRPGRVTANLIGMGIALFAVTFLGSRLPRRLSQTQLLYEEVLERLAEGIVAIDRRGRLLVANAEARRLLNWSGARRLVGLRYADVLRRREDRQVLDVLARGEDTTIELELFLRGQDPRLVEVKTTVLADEIGGERRIRGVVGIFRDLSLRVRAEEAEARLARLQDIEQIALGIAHEVRNPLGSIRGAVQELADRTLTDEEDRRLASIVRRESDRLDRLIQEFLDFARMRPPVRRPVELGGLVEETATMLRQHQLRGEVAISCSVEGEFVVSADPDQLRQAVLNVAVNALEAMNGAGRLEFLLLRSSVVERPEGGPSSLRTVPAAELEIANDGPPLAPEVARQLFTPFFTTKPRGLGLGMAITQKIVRNHGGDIAYRASEGRVRFRLLFPLLAQDPEQESPTG